MNDKEFQTSEQQLTPEYLQEKSDLIASLQQKLQNQEEGTDKLDPNVLPSVRSKEIATKHIMNLEEALAAMRQRGDYGIPNKDDKGNDLEGDMNFLDRPAQIPEELKNEM